MGLKRKIIQGKWGILIVTLFVVCFHNRHELFVNRTVSNIKSEFSNHGCKGSATLYCNYGEELGLLINTTNCKIPNFKPWSFEAKTLLEKRCGSFFIGEPNCAEKYPRAWSFLQDSCVHINLTAVRNSGYSWNSIRCCYRKIIRVKQSLEKNDKYADKIIKYSNKCYQIKKPIQFLNTDFIRLHCISTSLPTFGDVVYREFLANPKPDSTALEKIQRWKNMTTGYDFVQAPPNIIILGVDTMSRLNSQRNFNKTLHILRSIGATEMRGYTKVGGNTFPNTVGFLAGYTIREMMRFCYQNRSVPMDYCPYLFKSFNKVSYLTTTMEDVVLGTSFNFMKRGFVEKPVDFYFRPLMLAVMKHQFRPLKSYMRCLGSHQIERFILNYLEDILRLAQPTQTPVFAHVWLASLSHECGTSPKYVDDIFAEHIKKVISVHKNTILVFLGDHGETYAEFRETVQGWYEDNLPMSWIYLPPEIRRQFPEWQEALQINSNLLTSHFDLYKTLVQILQTFDKENLAEDTYKRLDSQRGQSLLNPLNEDRNCDNARIPDGFCVCSAPKDAHINDSHVVKSVQIAIEYIAKLLTSVCEQPILKEIIRAKSFKHPSFYMVYIVTFITSPGDFLFEATVKEKSDVDKELVIANEVQRLNKMSRKADCVEEPLLEKYCYCK